MRYQFPLCAALCIAMLGASLTAIGETVLLYEFEDGMAGEPVLTVTNNADGDSMDPDPLDGAVVGSMTYSDEVAADPRAGLLSLDATADLSYVEVPHDALLVTPTMTVQLLVMPRYDLFPGGGLAPHYMISKNWENVNPGLYLSSYSLAFDPRSDQFVVYVGYGDNSGLTVLSSLGYQSGVWYHVALTYQMYQGRSVAALYVDGELDGCVSAPPRELFFNEEPIYIGAGNFISPSGSFRGNFAGYLDAIRISNTVIPTARLRGLADLIFADDFEPDPLDSCVQVE